MTVETPPPPEHLSERSCQLWEDVAGRRVNSPEQYVLLRVALEALDEADECRRIIAEDGLVLTTLGSGTKHKHPLLDAGRSARAAFTKTWALLNLTFTPMDFGGMDR